MPLRRCMRETPSTDFLLWKVYLEKKSQERKREEYYLAQIAQEIRRTRAKNPRRVRLDPFLFKFKLTQKKKRQRPKRKLRRREIQQKIDQSKAAWLGFVGIQTPPKDK